MMTEWWQWAILIGGLALTVPISLIFGRILDKLDVEYVDTNTPNITTTKDINNISNSNTEE